MKRFLGAALVVVMIIFALSACGDVSDGATVSNDHVVSDGNTAENSGIIGGNVGARQLEYQIFGRGFRADLIFPESTYIVKNLEQWLTYFDDIAPYIHGADARVFEEEFYKGSDLLLFSVTGPATNRLKITYIDIDENGRVTIEIEPIHYGEGLLGILHTRILFAEIPKGALDNMTSHEVIIHEVTWVTSHVSDDPVISDDNTEESDNTIDGNVGASLVQVQLFRRDFSADLFLSEFPYIVRNREQWLTLSDDIASFMDGIEVRMVKDAFYEKNDLLILYFRGPASTRHNIVRMDIDENGLVTIEVVPINYGGLLLDIILPWVLFVEVPKGTLDDMTSHDIIIHEVTWVTSEVSE